MRDQPPREAKREVLEPAPAEDTPPDVQAIMIEGYRRMAPAERLQRVERQWGDVLGVLRVQGRGLSREYLDRGAEILGVEDLLARALREAKLEES